MNGKTLKLEVDGEGSSDPVALDPGFRGDVHLAQFDIATGPVQLEGRLNASAPWIELLDADVSADSIKAIASVKEVRLTGKTGASGVNTVYIQ